MIFHFQEFFRNNLCKGTILINSTVGFQSLFHSIPTKALGVSPYNLDGLADQNNLAFLKNLKSK